MAQQAIYRSVVKEAAGQGAGLVQRVVRRAVADMNAHAIRTAEAVERNQIAEAAEILSRHEASLAQAFPKALLAEFAHAIAGEPRKAGQVSFDTLELMGEDQVRDSLDVMRMQQAVMNAVEGELADLTALMCGAQGLRRVQPDRNPLRPEAYVRSLHQAVQQSPVAAPVRRRWMTHLGTAMGIELAITYMELCRSLQAQGVVPAGLAIATIAAVPRADDGLLNLGDLRKLIAGDVEDKPTGFSETMPASFETLREMKPPADIVKRLRDLPQGQGPAPRQALGLEVVRLMVEHLAADERLLAPVRNAVRELEPALMRIALEDPRFFLDKEHPARCLLDEITQRSLAWNAIDAPGFGAFYEPVREVVDALLDTSAPGPEPFAFALSSLREEWGDAPQEDQRLRENTVRALLKAQERNLLADSVSFTREEVQSQFSGEAQADSWVAQVEAKYTSAQTLFEETKPAPAAMRPVAPADPLEAIWPDEGLLAGTWVDLKDGAQWSRWQVTWATPQSTLFLLTHPSGRTQSMTRRLVDSMLAAGTLRLVSSHPVVADALDAIAQAALRNSAGLKDGG